MILTLALLFAQDSLPAPTIADLEGEWAISLYYSETDPPSATDMVITFDDDGAIGGSFYGSPFETAGTALRFDTPVIAAVTSDGSGPYYHSAWLVDGRLEGQTLSTGRGFVMVWTGERIID